MRVNEKVKTAETPGATSAFGKRECWQEREHPLSGEAADRRAPSWLWCGDTGDDRHVWAWARRSFHLEAVADAQLAISADLRYMLWVNGRRVGFGPPKFHAGTPTVDRYDLTGFLRAGRNVIAVQVYSLGPEKISSCSPQRGALWADLSIGALRVISDSQWRMRKDPGYRSLGVARRGTQPPNECYDARRGLLRPWETDYDDSDWPPAAVLSSDPVLAMEARDIPPMASERFLPDRLLEQGIATFSRPISGYPLSEMALAINQATLRPDRTRRARPLPGGLSNTRYQVRGDALAAHEAVYLIWDLGRIWSGYPTLRVSGSPGTVLDISYGEHLMNGRVNPAKSRMHYFDRLILGDSPVEYRVTWPKSARFIQLHVHGGSAELEEVAWERSTYPVVRQGSFASSSGVLDQAVAISLHTVQLCMEDSYMDTPWRERGSWLGDDLVKAQVAYDYFRDYALARRFLLHHARGQRANGMLQGKYPGNVTSNVSTWTLRFPSSLLEYCTASGDWSLARELWPKLERLVDWIASLQTPPGLFQAPPASVTAHSNHYNFIDWAPIDQRGINSAWNAFAYEALRCVETMARRTGRNADAERVADLRASVRAAFCKRLWDDRRGIFVNGLVDGVQSERWGCHENYLAMLYRLASDEQAARIIGRLKQEDLFTTFEADLANCEVELPGLGKIPTVSLALSQYRWPASAMVPIGTPYFAGYMIEALCEGGMVAEALRFIETRWGEFSRQGGTTVWETWNAEQSHSHGWSAIPAIFATRTILGVRLSESDNAWEILPSVACLKTFRGRVATRLGVVQVEWDGTALSVDIPEGGDFFAGLPERPGAALHVNGLPATHVVSRQRNRAAYLAVRLPAGATRLEMR